MQAAWLPDRAARPALLRRLAVVADASSTYLFPSSLRLSRHLSAVSLCVCEATAATRRCSSGTAEERERDEYNTFVGRGRSMMPAKGGGKGGRLSV